MKIRIGFNGTFTGLLYSAGKSSPKSTCHSILITAFDQATLTIPIACTSMGQVAITTNFTFNSTAAERWGKIACTKIRAKIQL